MRFIPYLAFGGDCREAFEFYEKTLGGRIEGIVTYGESPEPGNVPPGMHDKVMNAYIRIGDAELMASDMPGSYSKPTGTTVCIVNDDEGEAERIFRAFESGGTVVMPFGPTFWAKKFGMVTDRFGTPWMINSGMIE
jgi:PhnB protein